jgi:hypothetical protein
VTDELAVRSTSSILREDIKELNYVAHVSIQALAKSKLPAFAADIVKPPPLKVETTMGKRCDSTPN